MVKVSLDRRTIYIVVIAGLLLAVAIPLFLSGSRTSENMVKELPINPLEARFATLSVAKTNYWLALRS